MASTQHIYSDYWTKTKRCMCSFIVVGFIVHLVVVMSFILRTKLQAETFVELKGKSFEKRLTETLVEPMDKEFEEMSTKSFQEPKGRSFEERLTKREAPVEPMDKGFDERLVTNTLQEPKDRPFEEKLIETRVEPMDKGFEERLTETLVKLKGKDFEEKLTKTLQEHKGRSFAEKVTERFQEPTGKDFEKSLTEAIATPKRKGFEERLTETLANPKDKDFEERLTETLADPKDKDLEERLTETLADPKDNSFEERIAKTLLESKRKNFREILTREEKLLLMDTINIFSHTLIKERIPFFMYGGTLIGSWRHHGMVPWDDDVDFIVPFTLRKNISQILGRLEPTFHLIKGQTHRWKFFSYKAKKIRNSDWSFPFLDISFYLLNDTHLWDEDVKNFNTFIFPKDVVFPLTFRLFEGHQLPSPRYAKTMLEQTYDLNACVTGYYDHRLEEFKSEISIISCSELYPIYPFVHRVPVGIVACNETLLLNGTVLDWTVIVNKEC